MFAVNISEKGGSPRRIEFDKGEVTIGRVQGNDIILPKGNVSKRHSRIVLKEGRFIVVDLKSTNGTYVNGRKISSPLVVKPGDKIFIGDFILALEDMSASAVQGGAVQGDGGYRESGMPAPDLRAPSLAGQSGFGSPSQMPSMPPSQPPGYGASGVPQTGAPTYQSNAPSIPSPQMASSQMPASQMASAQMPSSQNQGQGNFGSGDIGAAIGAAGAAAALLSAGPLSAGPGSGGVGLGGIGVGSPASRSVLPPGSPVGNAPGGLTAPPSFLAGAPQTGPITGSALPTQAYVPPVAPNLGNTLGAYNQPPSSNQMPGSGQMPSSSGLPSPGAGAKVGRITQEVPARISVPTTPGMSGSNLPSPSSSFGAVPNLGQQNIGQPNIGQQNIGQPNIGQQNIGQPNINQPGANQVSASSEGYSPPTGPTVSQNVQAALPFSSPGSISSPGAIGVPPSLGSSASSAVSQSGSLHTGGSAALGNLAAGNQAARSEGRADVRFPLHEDSNETRDISPKNFAALLGTSTSSRPLPAALASSPSWIRLPKLHGALSPVARLLEIASHEINFLDWLNVDEIGIDKQERVRAALNRAVSSLQKSESVDSDIADLSTAEKEILVQRALDEAVSVGALTALLQDESVKAIRVNGPSSIAVKRQRDFEPSELQFSSETALVLAAARLLHPQRDASDVSSGLQASLAVHPSAVHQGQLSSRHAYQIILSPIARQGAWIHLERPALHAVSLNELAQEGVLAHEDLLRWQDLVAEAKTIFVLGSPASSLERVLGALAEESNKDRDAQTSAVLHGARPIPFVAAALSASSSSLHRSDLQTILLSPAIDLVVAELSAADHVETALRASAQGSGRLIVGIRTKTVGSLKESLALHANLESISHLLRLLEASRAQVVRLPEAGGDVPLSIEQFKIGPFG